MQTGSEARARPRLPPDQIRERARSIRRRIIRMDAAAGQGHIGADLSEADILATLFFNILTIDPGRPEDLDRDRFILSKGHGVGGLYCTLVEAGFLPENLLRTYLQFDSLLPGHPVRQKIPWIELNTGALGHGLSVGVGLAMAGRMDNRSSRVFVLTGDGELQEGSVWEAAMSAARFRLGNLVAIVDRNTLQLADRTEQVMPLEPLGAKWQAFGWDVHEVDGHDPAALIAVMSRLDPAGETPHVLIAHTTKGKGVSFMEDRAVWHHKVPDAGEAARALQELA